MLKISKLILGLFLITLAACSSKNVGNIPLATDGGPLADINFTYDSYSISSTAARKLDSNTNWLAENSDYNVTIEGHCDERATNEYNMALGLKRARAAYDYYVSAGIDADRLSVVSYGEELPINSASNEKAWSQNRRAHFLVK